MQYIYDDGSVRKRTPVIEEFEIISAHNALRELLIGKKYKFHAPNKLYKTALFRENRICYPVGKIYEDVFTTYKLFMAAKKVVLINNDLYFYRQNRENSILATSFQENRFSVLDAINEIKDQVELRGLSLLPELQCLYITNVISLINYLYPVYWNLSSEQKKAYKKKLQNHDWAYRYFFNRQLSIFAKIRYFLIRHFFAIYIYIKNFQKIT